MTNLGPTNIDMSRGLVNLLNLVPNVAETTGTFSYDETSALEQTLLTLTIADPAKINSIWLDFVNVTRDTTIRLYHQIDGSVYRLFQENVWVTADDDGVLIDGFTAIGNVRITVQCDGGGVGSIDIPYGVI